LKECSEVGSSSQAAISLESEDERKGRGNRKNLRTKKHKINEKKVKEKKRQTKAGEAINKTENRKT